MKLKKLLDEKIIIPVEIGDTILVGKFKNKKIVVKSIEYDDMGLPIINGRKGVTFKLAPKPNIYEDQINENPDMIDGLNLVWREQGTHAFGVYNKKLYLSPPQGKHYEMNDSLMRKDYKFAGRLWSKQKALSFWTYPTKIQLKKIIKDINKQAKENSYGFQIDSSWQIEIIADENGNWLKKIPGTYFGGGWSDYDVHKLKGKNIMIPLDMYASSAKRSEAEKGKTHLLSPLLKKMNAERQKKLSSLNKSREKKLYTTKEPVVKQKARMTKYKFTEDVNEA